MHGHEVRDRNLTPFSQGVANPVLEFPDRLAHEMALALAIVIYNP